MVGPKGSVIQSRSKTMQDTVICGSGGHAKVIIEILREAGIYRPIGCVAPSGTGTSSVLGVPIVGDDDQLPPLRQAGIVYAFVALGDNRLRARLLRQLQQLGFELACAVSPAATISPSATLGSGIAIMPGAHVGPDVVIEDGVIINSHASVDHDCALRTCCHIGPGATLAGSVTVGEGAFVATGASLIPGIVIGDGSLVGAGSVVVRDVPPQMLAFGTPARCRRSLSVGLASPVPADREPASQCSSTLRLVS
jgi:UDP-perosamine 4-acetyltransferase